jgi:hypothetical protein
MTLPPEIRAGLDQHLAEPFFVLAASGYEPVLWQSGGWCMILTVHHPLGQVWVTANEHGTYMVATYTQQEIDDGDEPNHGYDDGVALDDLPDKVRALMLIGIEKQWVDTTVEPNRILTFDEVERLGLDGTLRT